MERTTSHAQSYEAMINDIIYIQTIVEHDGEVHLSNLPIRRGQQIELHVRIVPVSSATQHTSPAQTLLESGIIGIWADRIDIGDSVLYARHLRDQAQRRDR